MCNMYVRVICAILLSNCYDGMAGDVLLVVFTLFVVSCLLFVGIYGAAAESKTSFPKRDNKVYRVALRRVVSYRISGLEVCGP